MPARRFEGFPRKRPGKRLQRKYIVDRMIEPNLALTCVAPTMLIAQFFVHNIQQRQAVHVAPDVFTEYIHGSLVRTWGSIASVRSNDDVAGRPQRVIGGQRFRFRHVERSARDAAFL